ncbi:latexin [Rhinoraja longicauda]
MYSVLCLVSCFLSLLNGISQGNNLAIPDINTEIPTNARAAQQAASVAMHYLNYHHGSPHKVYQLLKLKKASLETMVNEGHKYHLEFEVNNETSSNVAEFCTAKVLFYKKSIPDTVLKCNLKDSDGFTKDNEFYLNLRKRMDPVVGNNIPDNFGFIAPEMRPIWKLARVSASYIMWQKSTEVLKYNMAQIREVNQQIGTDTFLQFTYIVLLHEIPSQEIITCNMSVKWQPKQSPNVKYTCLPPATESEFGRREGMGRKVPRD